MTGVQKILARAAKKPTLFVGEELILPETAPGISSDDPACGAYGSLFLHGGKIRVPRGIFIDLCGALRDDVTSAAVAEYLVSLCRPYLAVRSAPLVAPEFGGDSLTYLTIEDRLETAKRLIDEHLGFAPLFECDFVAAQYAEEKGLPRLAPLFNDSPDDFEAIVRADLAAI